MRVVCPSCRGNAVSLNMDVEVRAVFDDGTIELVAPGDALGYGTLVCDDCDIVEDRNTYNRQAWIQAAIDEYDKYTIIETRTRRFEVPADSVDEAYDMVYQSEDDRQYLVEEDTYNEHQ